VQDSNGESTLAGLKVRDAMERQFVEFTFDDPVCEAISSMIRYRADAVLVSDALPEVQGVVTKTDLMSAYYACFPPNTPLGDITSAAPFFCTEETLLESALEMMEDLGVHQLFVREAQDGKVTGVLAYGDIVDLMYRFCCECRRYHTSQEASPCHELDVQRFRVREVMTGKVVRFSEEGSLYDLMETLSVHEFWGLFMEDEQKRPSGVVSKTDLILAYMRGVAPETRAREIMSPRIHTCAKDSLLSEAIALMISREVHRVFVHDQAPDYIVGVLSCTDAARRRSASCRTCHASPAGKTTDT
jgi:CBS domain-containing protein